MWSNIRQERRAARASRPNATERLERQLPGGDSHAGARCLGATHDLMVSETEPNGSKGCCYAMVLLTAFPPS